MTTYPDIVSPDFYITHGVAVVGSTSGEAAVLADSHMLGFTMIQSVLIVLWTAPGPDVLGVHQQVSGIGRGLLEMGLYVGMAAGRVTPEANLLGLDGRAAAAQDAVQDRRRLLDIQSVELLYNVGQFVVLLQTWLLAVGVVALGTAHHARIFRPGLVYTHAAEVVFAGELNRLGEHVQTNGAY